MEVQIVNTIRVTPPTYWGQLFFDPDYLRGLYVALAFPLCEVQQQSVDTEGRTRRVLRAVPPFSAPDFIRKKLEGRLFYTEDGTYDPRTGRWSFSTAVSVASDKVDIRGVIHTEPVAHGLRHVLDLTAKVSAFGVGPLFERLIEKNTRDSYAVMADFTNRFALERGFAVS
ncbi:MAG TPA: DUF2505 domain-containing protein [Polyangiales bacterium]